MGAGFVGGNGGTTIAHELGHVLAFAHVFGNLPADDNKWDQAYPAYEPYDAPTARTGTIGEYGLDVTTSTVMRPTWATDFMGYGMSPWMSPYHHQLMIQNPRLSPEWVPLPKDTLPPVDEQWVEWPPAPPNPPDPPWGEWTERVRPAERGPLVVVAGRRSDGRVEMSHVLRVDAFAGSEGRVISGMRVELLGFDGDVLSRAPVYELPTRASGTVAGAAMRTRNVSYWCRRRFPILARTPATGSLRCAWSTTVRRSGAAKRLAAPRRSRRSKRASTVIRSRSVG